MSFLRNHMYFTTNYLVICTVFVVTSCQCKNVSHFNEQFVDMGEWIQWNLDFM